MGRARSAQRVAALALLAWLTFDDPALALADPQPGPEPLRFSVDYRAHDGCPPEDAFRRGVESRAQRATSTDETNAAAQLVVTLARDGERTTGALVVTLPDGTRSERQVRDASCEAAASSLAVMSALALDARLEAPEPKPEHPAEPAVRPPEPSAPPASPVPERPAPAAVAERRAPAPFRQRSGPERARSLEVRARAHGVYESAAAPSLPLGALAGGELNWESDGMLAPAVGVSALATLPRRSATSIGGASFRLLAARVTVCPLRLRLPAGGSVRVCAELDAGALTGSADAEVRNRATRTMPWLAAGLGIRGALPVAGGLELEAAGGGRGLARDDRFVFRPDLPVYDVPRLSAGATLGVSYGF